MKYLQYDFNNRRGAAVGNGLFKSSCIIPTTCPQKPTEKVKLLYIRKIQ